MIASSIHLGAAGVATLVANFIGFVWYHQQVFGSTWLRETFAGREMPAMQSMTKSMVAFFIGEFVSNLLFQFLVITYNITPLPMHLFRLAAAIEIMSAMSKWYSTMFSDRSIIGFGIDALFQAVVACTRVLAFIYIPF